MKDIKELEENRPDRDSYESPEHFGSDITYMRPERLQEYKVDLIEWSSDRNALLLKKIALLIEIHSPELNKELKNTFEEVIEGLEKETAEEEEKEEE